MGNVTSTVPTTLFVAHVTVQKYSHTLDFFFACITVLAELLILVPSSFTNLRVSNDRHFLLLVVVIALLVFRVFLVFVVFVSPFVSFLSPPTVLASIMDQHAVATAIGTGWHMEVSFTCTFIGH
jgi:phosphatidylserine synthase